MSRKPKSKISDTNPEHIDSLRRASALKGVSVKLLRTAKGMGAPGFHGSRLHWEEFQPWFEENKEEVEQVLNDKTGIDALRKENLSLDAEKKRVEIDKLKDNLLDKEDVRNLIRALSKSVSIILDEQLKPLPLTLLGKKTEEIEQTLTVVKLNILKLLKDIKLDVN